MDLDASLIRKMKGGNRSAFNRFVEKYYDNVFYYCYTRCSSHELAEDLTQETFLHFFVALPDYHHRGKLKNFLYVIAGNLIKNEYGRKKDIPTDQIFIDVENQLQSERQPDERVIEDRKLIMDEAISQLEKTDQSIIRLYYYNGFSYSEISSYLNIGLSDVKYRMQKSKKLLKQILNVEE
jgi:RNA polymerase sigma factor (sigma-70 family)